MELQKLLSHVRRACDNYNMIDEGDNIAVGISGGKDSLALLVALAHLRRFYPKKFNVRGITVSLGFPNFDLSSVYRLCEKLDVQFDVIETDIGKIVFEDRKESNPCALCSKMRKGALNSEAVKLDCNKVALGHNKDDVLQTFFLSLFYEAQIHTFSPVTYLDRKNVTLIRPLVYVPEKDIISFVKKQEITPVKSPCPVDGLTKRETMKEFIYAQAKEFDNFSHKVFGAIERAGICGWRQI